ncbi:hypothetical protein SAY86_008253 [Trapa natans]|uniref:BHLH domain-containing protein n=1 Tax=Trapa natans TaxID=22666 RepID=A0AAN7QE95_TRANT|nr:hypothetical protein SAY86_008253 [Trapa natans]
MMDRFVNGTSATATPLVHLNDFLLPEFFDHGADSFDPFAILIPGDTVAGAQGDVPAGGGDGMVVDGQRFSSGLEDILGGFNCPAGGMEDSNLALGGSQSITGDLMNGEEDGFHDDEDDDDYSSGTTPTMKTTSSASTPSPVSQTRKTKVDRSRTLISERRRRGRMKEKLYALRALVPNITKMDKASIVGDAVLYVQELQMQAKKLKAEIAGLEATLPGSQKDHQRQPDRSPKKIHLAPKGTGQAVPRKILQMDVFQVERRGFYVRLVSNRGVGVAASLYKALESLTSFTVQSSNLTSSSSSDRFILTFTLNQQAKGNEPDLSLPNLRLRITGSLLNQGFELIQTANSLG